MSRTENPIRHGTPYAYSKRGCRCDECTEANRLWHLAYRARRKERTGRACGPRGDRPIEGHNAERPCAACGATIIRPRAQEPQCKPCRLRAKRAVYVPAAVRRAIYDRDDWTCGICSEAVEPGLPSSSPWQATLDHVIPRSKGGSDEPSNLRLAHRYCNAVRSNRDALTIDELVA